MSESETPESVGTSPLAAADSSANSASDDAAGTSTLHNLPDSPCIGICSTLFDEVCQGCGRTAAEVYNWVFLSEEERLAIWKRITEEGTAVRFTRGPQG